MTLISEIFAMVPFTRGTSLLTKMKKANALHRQRNDLASLPQERLIDLGLSQRDVASEIRKPIWDAPVNWRK